MPCPPEELRHVPLFSLLDDDEVHILAAQIDVRSFAAGQQIYRADAPGGLGYVLLTGKVRITSIDDDQEEVLVDEPSHGDFFGFASMLQASRHQTSAMAMDAVQCLEISRDDLEALIKLRPLAGMDMLTVLARQFQAVERLAQSRTGRNPNEVIAELSTVGERIADGVARFGGSWSFIILFGVTLVVYTAANIVMKGRAWDPYPFILLNLFLSMLAAIQAPVIMMSQNRQDAKDRLRSELDFEVNKRAEAEIQTLVQAIEQVNGKLDAIGRQQSKT